MIIYTSDGISDDNLLIFKEDLAYIDKYLIRIDDLLKIDRNLANNDSLDVAEYKIGLGFVILQKYIQDTCNSLGIIDKVSRDKAIYNTKPYLKDEVTLVSVINACANYWKHLGDFTPSNDLQNNQEKTLKRLDIILQMDGSTYDYYLSNILAEMTCKFSKQKSVRLSSLVPQMEIWRDELLKKSEP